MAVKQKLGKKDIDRWIKGGLWKVDTFKSANELSIQIDIIPNALRSQSWKSQSLQIEEESRHAN